MMIFFGQLLKSKPQAKFLFVTNESPHAILSNAKKYSIPEEKIIIRFAERTVVPALLSLSDISVFFIKPCFSKTASSPTKLGELMAMGIPVICNSGVGDVEAIMQKTQAGVALKDFSEPEMKRAIEAINSLTSKDRNEIRQEALKYFSLEFGVEKYAGVYEKLFRDN
jgi:glycosyltransferase involved in cell wall biosynthesis